MKGRDLETVAVSGGGVGEQTLIVALDVRAPLVFALNHGQ